MLGMYVHTHWSYSHPYAARSWTFEDWRHYLSGLKSLGYDLVMIWPLLDLMPAELTPSDEAFLTKIGNVIDWAHNELQMKVAITIGANIIGNDRARNYTFEDRPYFICEHRTDLNDVADRTRLLAARRQCFSFIRDLDYLVMIDSDPGGMPGSTNLQFVELMRDQLQIARELNPAIEMTYWMWVGWENYNKFWGDCAKWQEGDPEVEIHWPAPVFIETLKLMKTHIAEPWNLFTCFDEHLQAVAELGLEDRILHFPYGAVEGEPSFPLTNHHPQIIAERMAPLQQRAYPNGTMCNAQTHCLQLPGTYYFAHLAQGGTLDNADLAGFGDSLIAGAGTLLAEAWQVIESESAPALRAAAARVRARAALAIEPGPRSGLLFGDPLRFLGDLADNLTVRAALIDVHAALTSGQNIKAALLAFLADFEPYQRKLGFVDAYGGGPVFLKLNEPLKSLGDARINAVLREFIDWKDPLVHNGTMVRLLEAIRAYAQS